MINRPSKKYLVITGNGFDLAHDCKTSYKDFKEYIEDSYSDLAYYLECCSPANLWTDFENKLGELDVSELYSNILDGINIFGNDEDEHNYHQKADEINIVETLLIDGLKNALNDWVLTIDVNKEKKVCLEKILKEADIVTFNYTKTIESIYERDVIHLHGKAQKRTKWDHHDISDPVSNLVVGHGNANASSDLDSVKTTPSYEIVVEEAESNGHRDVLKELYKNTSKQMMKLQPIFSNAGKYTKVFIIGHSLSQIDAPYFTELSTKLDKTAQIIVSYYDDSDLFSKKQVIPILFPNNKNKLINIDAVNRCKQALN